MVVFNTVFNYGIIFFKVMLISHSCNNTCPVDLNHRISCTHKAQKLSGTVLTITSIAEVSHIRLTETNNHNETKIKKDKWF